MNDDCSVQSAVLNCFGTKGREGGRHIGGDGGDHRKDGPAAL